MTRKNIRIAGAGIEEGKKCYSELKELSSYLERYKYLKLDGRVGIETFGFDRYLNQVFYKDKELWLPVRREVIIRDNGCDMGDPDHPINGRIIIHHMNPITERDILERNPDIFNPEYLICVSLRTHNAIHYGDEDYIRNKEIVTRRPNDTCPWKN